MNKPSYKDKTLKVVNYLAMDEASEGDRCKGHDDGLAIRSYLLSRKSGRDRERRSDTCRWLSHVDKRYLSGKVSFLGLLLRESI